MHKINSWAKREAFRDGRNPWGRYRAHHQQKKKEEEDGIPNDTQPQRTPTHAPKMDKSIWGQLRHSVFNSWINVLLVAVPIGIALHFVKGITPVAVFVVNFIAIIPLAGLLSYATEELALRVGETLGGLLNASFGNAVELIVSIIALIQNEIVVVQTSLIGSILSNLLLVLGMSFLFGGWTRFEQYFNTTVASTASSLLTLAVLSLIVPTAFHWATTGQTGQSSTDAQTLATKTTSGIVKLSRGTSIILLLVYGSYLFFQLKSHARLFSEPSQKAVKRKDLPPDPHHEGGGGQQSSRSSDTAAVTSATDMPKAEQPGATGVLTNRSENGNAISEGESEDAEEEREEPQLTVITAVIVLAASTVLVAVCAEFLVSSINEIVVITGISRYFVGLILLPIVGNAAEHATSVTVACKDKMDLAIGVAVGSSMQVALLVIPFIVVLGWIMGKDDMTLYFDGFQVVILFGSVLLVNYLIQDGKSNFLEGNMLIATYIIIAVAAYLFPLDQPLG